MNEGFNGAYARAYGPDAKVGVAAGGRIGPSPPVIRGIWQDSGTWKDSQKWSEV